jgi:hypothetical protein
MKVLVKSTLMFAGTVSKIVEFKTQEEFDEFKRKCYYIHDPEEVLEFEVLSL